MRQRCRGWLVAGGGHAGDEKDMKVVSLMVSICTPDEQYLELKCKKKPLSNDPGTVDGINFASFL